MDGKRGTTGIVCRIAYYGAILLVVLFAVYSFLNWVTIFLWGDPSALQGEPRTFHPPQIVILHYANIISPGFGQVIVALLFSGCLVFAYLGYRQITRKNSLDHPTRDRIAGHIRSHPGCHFRSIMRATGINRGTLSYHIHQLAAMGLVHEVRVRGMTRYFLPENGRSALKETILIHRDNRVRCRILDMLEQSPSVTRAELKKDLGISGPALWYHMQLLFHDGITCEIKEPQQIGRPVRYALSVSARQTAEKMRGAPGSPAGAGGLSESRQGQGTLAGQ